MRNSLILTMLVALAIPVLCSAQGLESAEPFKVGTFEIVGTAHVGIVLRDSLVVDLHAANVALERDRPIRKSRRRQTCWSSSSGTNMA